MQDLQKEQAERQRSRGLAPGLPEELHSVPARSWKLVTAARAGWRWLTAPPPRTRAQGLWEGWGRRVGSEQNVTLLSRHRIKKKFKQQRKESCFKTWSLDEKQQLTQPSPAAEPSPWPACPARGWAPRC